MAEQYYYGTGRRKTAIARVRLYPGGGAIIVNGKPLDEIFDRDMHRDEVMLPLKRVGAEGKFSAQVKCEGGGVSGWAGAIRLGIARALVEADPCPQGHAQARPQPPHPRCASEGAQEARPQARPQGASVHQALAQGLGSPPRRGRVALRSCG